MNAVVDKAIAIEVQSAELAEKLGKAMAKPGRLKGIPPLLEKRRLRYGMPDGCFKRQCAFDRILVWQIGEAEGETFSKDGKIVMPETSKARLKDSTPRGVIVSAGAKALDVLRTNGMDIGYIVNFIRFAVWNIEADVVEGRIYPLMVLRVGDIVASEDTREDMLRGDLRIELDAESAAHCFVRGKRGKKIIPIEPWLPEDT